MKAIVPITFRVPTDLKSKVDALAAARRLSLNAFAQVALENEVAGACEACGRAPRYVPRGVTPEFGEFVRAQHGGSIYVRLERRGVPVVYKGRLPRIYGRHLHLDAESTSGGEQKILLDEVVDWETARSGPSTADWDRAHPGLAVESWGLGA